MNTELEEMRQQMAVLKKKLEQQEIISDRLISKTKESLEKDMATVRRKYRMGYVVSILAVPYLYYMVVYQFGGSVAFGIGTVIWALVNFIHYYWRKGNLYDMHSDNLLEAQRQASTLKQSYSKWIKIDYLFMACWLAWFTWEVHLKSTMEGTGDTPRFYFVFIIGMLMALPLSIWQVIKTHRRYQRILDQIEDLTAEA
ncbi:MAG: hypothetical protein IJS97_08260 [Prevotella sp.]|nr:hypothetical protein [Prevotella sp.]